MKPVTLLRTPSPCAARPHHHDHNINANHNNNHNHHNNNNSNHSNNNDDKVEPPITTTLAHSIAKTLSASNSPPWYIVAFTSQFLVWVAILSAFVVSYTAPTLGLGCRTLTYLVFGVFSSVSWFLMLLGWLGGSKSSRWSSVGAVWLSRVCNVFAVATLLVAVLFQVRLRFHPLSLSLSLSLSHTHTHIGTLHVSPACSYNAVTKNYCR